MTTARVWLATPPEIHSALLSSGPGHGPLLATAAAWQDLSTQYAAAADELAALLAAVPAHAWEGTSAQRYVDAHAAYLAWLRQVSTDSAATASQHQTAAAAYTTAAATMPSLTEISANRARHGALLSTNFFGINTIPITANELDYVRMWVQAATTMAIYSAVVDTALTSTPSVHPAPRIMTSAAAAASSRSAHAARQDLAHIPAADCGAALDRSAVLAEAIARHVRSGGTDDHGELLKLLVSRILQALQTWGPLLFVVAYQVFFNLVGWPTWALILSSPARAPTEQCRARNRCGRRAARDRCRAGACAPSFPHRGHGNQPSQRAVTNIGAASDASPGRRGVIRRHHCRTRRGNRSAAHRDDVATHGGRLHQVCVGSSPARCAPTQAPPAAADRTRICGPAHRTHGNADVRRIIAGQAGTDVDWVRLACRHSRGQADSQIRYT
ncbi:PPE family protein [Mycolicibacterium wolinskyi]|uniref:PPE family protein n=1 Tax=Mycolicibacterium wolinskyi TaxID=59750 RepID=UPI000AAE178C|nr:PPE family protein [Mycolicibacterium wolinskyi]